MRARVIFVFLFLGSINHVRGNPYDEGAVNYNPNCSADFRTATIGAQVWAAENLNCAVEGSRCYKSKQSNCDKYGRLYNWNTALMVCPKGWHLPTQAEWNALMDFVQSNGGCSSCDARLLKAASGWNSGGNGTDDYGFSALPGGYGSSDGSFNDVGYYGIWWSASEYSSTNAFYRDMIYNSKSAYWYNLGKSGLFSVRCVKD